MMILPILLLLSPPAHAHPDTLRCELRVESADGRARDGATFTLKLGTPTRGEVGGYGYYLTYQKTTRRAVTFQVSRGDAFFLHGSSVQPEAGLELSGLGFDQDARSSVYLGCAEK